MKKYILKVLLLLAIFPITSCEDILEEEVYSEMTPGNFLTTPEGKLSILYSAYGNIQLRGFWSYFLSTNTSGEAWNSGGSIESIITPLTNFTWDSNLEWFNNAWNTPYAAIRDANILLDNTQSGSDEFNNQLIAEAKFIRGLSYYYLYDWFGPVPIYDTSTPEDFKLPRSSDEEMRTFIEQDLTEAAAVLPLTQPQYGRATKGSALGILCKYYLNTLQWQKCADVAKQIMDMDMYSLVPAYKDVFSLANEGNEEMLWVVPATPQAGHSIVALTFPTDYPLPQPNQQVFAARSYFFDSFVNSFAAGDTRKDLIVTEYVNTAGKPVQLLGNNQSLSGKYEFDPNANGAAQGNDIPVVRYSDILLSRAEALNELNGPTQEVIDLINMVRARAGVYLLNVGDFTKESLRDHLLQERAWEFYAEIKSRQDQIRQGKFISMAQSRGKNAQPFHVLFPIPIAEINANPKLEQNPGY